MGHESNKQKISEDREIQKIQIEQQALKKKIE